jgi:spore coat protein U-like protein
MSILGAILVPLLAVGAPAQALCSVQLQGVSFGTVDVTRREESTGSIRVSCDRAQAFLVEIGGPLSGGQRRMQAAGGASLRYELYGDPGHHHVLGDGLTIGAPLGGASDGAQAQTFTVYGVVPPQPGTPPGAYFDAPVVTLAF